MTIFKRKCLIHCMRHAQLTKRHTIRHLCPSSTRPCFSRADRTSGCPDIDPGLDPCSALFAVFVKSFVHFPHVKAMTKRAFFQHVPRAPRERQRPSFWTLHWPVTSPKLCANFSLPPPAVWSARVTHWPLCTMCGQTNRQTDRQTDRWILFF